MIIELRRFLKAGEPVKMKEAAKFTVFRTKWGYFALAGTQTDGISAAVLPEKDKRQAEQRIRKRTGAEIADETPFSGLKQRVLDYFEGERVDFSDVPVVPGGLSRFEQKVLSAARKVEFGQTVSYSELAEMVSTPKAARAVGNTLARNLVPLIIPCHRIIRSDGTPGKFSSGTTLKKRLIEHERKIALC